MFKVKLTDDLLLQIAKGKPAVSGWPDDNGEDESLARYKSFIEDIQSLPVSVNHDKGWHYGYTFFGFFLYHSQSEKSFDGCGLHVSLCRFAPIGIYGDERRAWGPRGGHEGFPTPYSMYQVLDPGWQSIAEDVRSLMEQHAIYLPNFDELTAPIEFPLPESFVPNRGASIVFDIIFNDFS